MRAYIGDDYALGPERSLILTPNSYLRQEPGVEPLPNAYDACLLRELEVWDEIVSCGGLQKHCCPKGRKPYAQRPWIAMPAEGRRFKPVGVLAVPGPAGFNGVDTKVLTFTVPVGYDGVITDIVCEITAQGGTGFVEGSGDLTWRLSANTRFLRDYGNIIVSQGSLITPSPVQRSGIRIFSQDIMLFTVAFAAGADVRINPAANVICSVTGWYYPR